MCNDALACILVWGKEAIEMESMESSIRFVTLAEDDSAHCERICCAAVRFNIWQLSASPLSFLSINVSERPPWKYTSIVNETLACCSTYWNRHKSYKVILKLSRKIVVGRLMALRHFNIFTGRNTIKAYKVTLGHWNFILCLNFRKEWVIVQNADWADVAFSVATVKNLAERCHCIQFFDRFMVVALILLVHRSWTPLKARMQHCFVTGSKCFIHSFTDRRDIRQGKFCVCVTVDLSKDTWKVFPSLTLSHTNQNR